MCIFNRKKKIAKVNNYIQQALSGHNPHDLRFDEKWVRYLYEGTRMTFKKQFFLVCCLLPSFSKVFIFSSLSLNIYGCSSINENGATRLPLGTCFELNNDSLTVKIPFESLSFYYLLYLFISQILVILPQIIFFVYFLWSQDQKKTIMWLKGAKLSPPTLDKRCTAFKDWVVMILFIILIYFCASHAFLISSGIAFIDLLPTYVNINDETIQYHYEDNMSMLWNLINTFLAYSCVLVAYKNFIKEPMMYFYGFRKYCKEASKVVYNTNSTFYRCKVDWISVYFYKQCQKNDCYKVLVAYVTYLIDKKLLIESEKDQEEDSKEYFSSSKDQSDLENTEL